MSDMPWVTISILLPLAAGALLLLFPARSSGMARGIALAAALATFVSTDVVVHQFARDGAGPQLIDRQDWVSSLGLEWLVWVDGISVWLLLLTSALFLLAIGVAALRAPDRGPAFLGLLLLAEAGLIGLFSAGNLVLFYVFWEAMLIPFYFLIGTWGEGDRLRNTTRFVIYTMVGSLVMLVGIVATAYTAKQTTGQFTFDIDALRGVAFTRTESIWLFAAFALAFAIKLPLWPFHGWMPGAYGSAPILVTGLLAAVMSKAGVYGFLRIGVPLFPEGAETFKYPIILLALTGIIYGSLVAWRQTTMRMVVAYSSLAHLGFIALAIMSFDNQAGQGAVLQMVNHGIVVAAAFVIVGILSSRTGHEEVDDIGGLANGAPWLAGLFLVVTMASLAIPGSNAFAGEFFILSGVFRQDWWVATIASIGIVYAAVYMLRLYQSSMNGPLRGGEPRKVELTWADAAVLVPLIGAMAVLALWPAAIIGGTTRTVERTMAPAQLATPGFPQDLIKGSVTRNPPAEALPLPGDPDPAVPEVQQSQEPTP
ncbi:MAG: NADH-quinone oxidoreductase subunit M [Actinobacteria bacterium]|nr:NADH-quinone oxidoreductase subunit M [Actinomycetota bacterium]